MNRFKVIVCHGLQRTDLKIDPSETLLDLQNMIEEDFKIPVSKQKIICKGKGLKDTSATIESLGIKEGDRLMVLGKPYNMEKDPIFQQILKVEKICESKECSLKVITSELDSLPTNEEKQTKVGSSCKKLLQINEELMKSLEDLDLITFEQYQNQARAKRKALIQRIQRLMDDVDKAHENFKSALRSS